jgi:hypothetical protein
VRADFPIRPSGRCAPGFEKNCELNEVGKPECECIGKPEEGTVHPTDPGLTTQMTFTGWRFGLDRCAAHILDPGSTFAISDGQEAHIDTAIPGTGTPRNDGRLDCSYSISWPLRYGVTYQVSMAGGSCRLTVFENSILKESSLWWNFVAEIHFYDGTCWPWPPS